ncbi:MAG TPA: DUF2243 domain-containing protein [Longimicrobium sp.]
MGLVRHGPRTRSGIVIGVGMGGFVDGIVLHQILQWHNMGSSVLRPDTMEAMRRNMVWDGLFHAGTWLAAMAGIVMLWSHARRGHPLPGPRALTGQFLLGWGLFNLVEGLIDHHLLALHHVRDLPAHVPLYDWIFLGIGGVAMILVGWLMSRPRRDPLLRR